MIRRWPLLVVLIALTAMMMAPDTITIDLPHRLAPPGSDHWLGTDELGRDVLARLLAGGRVSLAVALSTTLLATLLGSVVGITAGWRGGGWDGVLMRLTDGLMTLPLLPLLIVLAALDPKQWGLPADLAQSQFFAIARLVVVLALTSWTGVARLTRGQTLSLKSRDHVRAAQALGVPPVTLVRRHVLPHLASPLLVAASSALGSIILTESALSFLGLGIRPPTPSWGNMLSGAMDMVWTSPLLALWPGLAIFLCVLAVSRLGDSLSCN